MKNPFLFFRKRRADRIRKEKALLIKWAVSEASKRTIEDMVARIGIVDLEKIVEEGRTKQKICGYVDYTSLGEMYGKLLERRK